MNNTTINGALLKEMFLTGAALLEKNKAYVDSLNVFPVPDGDTGTNMSMTMQSAVKEIKACNGLTIAKGDIIGLKDNAITSVGKTVEDATLSLIEKMLEDREEAMVTLYFGEGVTEEQANELSERIMAKLPDTEIIAIPGGQPLYYYYISVE